MKKRIFCLILVLCMALTLLPASAFAATVVKSGTCGYNLTWTFDSEGTLTISGTGAMTDYSVPDEIPWCTLRGNIKTVNIKSGVTSIGSSAFYGCSSLTGVSIPSGVTSIGDIAFLCCSSLTSVSIPSSVTSIGSSAFCACSSLTSISIPSSVTSIGASAFKGCSSLTGVSVPSSVKSIGAECFFNCSSLTSVTIPDSVTSIGYTAFHGCSSLTGVSIPSSVKSIGASCFFNCSSLTSVTIPDSVTSIGYSAFYGCSSLTSVSIPSSVKSIGDIAFLCCSSLTAINVASNNGNYCSVNGVFFNKDKTKLIQYPSAKEGTFYSIPESVISIDDYALFGCSSLTGVSIPSSVTSIESSAFSCCYSLRRIEVSENNTAYCSVNGALFNKAKTELIQYPCGSTVTSFDIPDGVTRIGDETFADCYTLSSVTIPDTVTAIGELAFRGCYNISEIKIPSGVKYIYNYTFGGCTGLKSIVIPDTVTKIYEGAFSYCSSLKNVYFCGTEEQWNSITVNDNNDCLKNANVIFNFVPSPFTDVSLSSAYYDAVQWGNSKGIVSGFTATEFRPNNTCTRAQVVTFLWRAAGSPEPQTIYNPFSDVSAVQANGKANPFYKAILWGVEKGITSGYSDGTFRPNDTVTRAQFVTFLWRYEGQPTSNTALTFNDTNTIAKGYRDAVAWGVEKGVIAGYGDNTFRPNATCTRWQVVLFMYRDMK